MSLNIALLNALSGLQVNQRALDATSQNVSNVNTEGYSRKIVQQAAAVFAGQGAGVSIVGIARNVNEFLVKDLRTVNGTVVRTRTEAEFFERMQTIFGSPGSDSSVSAQIADLAARLQALAATPESLSTQTEVMNQAKLLALSLNGTAAEIQDLRLEADRAIAEAVATINTNLARIEELNIKIAQGLSLNQGVGELQDQRDIALNAITEQMDVRYFTRSNGEIVIFTATGRTLLDRTAQTISHDAAGALSALSTWAAGTIDQITLNSADVTSEISSGRIKALIDMRDTILPNLHSQFEELSVALHDEINAVHNQGTAFPGASTLTGTRSFNTADTPSWSGNFRVTVVDANGVVLETQDFNLATYANVGALVAAINGMANANASIGATGTITVSATGAGRLAVNEMTSAVRLGSATLGAGQFLGLNDFFTSSNDHDVYTSAYQTTRTTALGIAGTLTFAGAFGTTNVGYVAGDSLDNVVTSINGNAALTAAGISASVVTDGSGFRLRIVDSGGDNFYVTDSGAFLTNLTVKARGFNISGEIAVRSDIVSDPSRVSRARLSSAAPLVVGASGVAPGDSTTVQALADKFNQALSFTATGQLAASNRTLAEYGTSILGMNATQSDNATTDLRAREFLYQNLREKAESISGVNLDEEMANLIVLENAYSASARVITTISEMFDILDQIAR